MNEFDFVWLLNWYKEHCNKDWEHREGIKIETIDNPGWSLTINLEDTKLENQSFNKIKVDRSDDDWFICFVDNNHFEGRGGVDNLVEILKIFRKWAENAF